MKVTVCKGCADRHPACHDHCLKYIDEKQKNEAHKQAVEDKRRGDLEVMRFYKDRRNKRQKKYKEDLW